MKKASRPTLLLLLTARDTRINLTYLWSTLQSVLQLGPASHAGVFSIPGVRD